MNILGIDYGTKYIGLAWTQTGLDVVLPFGKVETGNWKLEIGEMTKKEHVSFMVVGLPVGLNGKENENTKRVREFAAELKKYIDVPIEFVDERFSSRAADTMGKGVSRDERAAMIILQTYLELRKNKER